MLTLQWLLVFGLPAVVDVDAAVALVRSGDSS